MKTHPAQTLEIREDHPVSSALLELLNQVFDFTSRTLPRGDNRESDVLPFRGLLAPE
jgi:hypothetical protein